MSTSMDTQEPEDDLPTQHEVERAPRTVDLAAWVARGIVVLTIALVTIVGGLLLGMSVTDQTSSTATPAPTTSTRTATATTTIPTESATFRRGPTAPPVRISAAAPDARDAPTTPGPPATVVRTSQATATQPPSTTSAPTTTATTRGKSTNTGKPKPTKPN